MINNWTNGLTHSYQRYTVQVRSIHILAIHPAIHSPYKDRIKEILDTYSMHNIKLWWDRNNNHIHNTYIITHYYIPSCLRNIYNNTCTFKTKSISIMIPGKFLWRVDIRKVTVGSFDRGSVNTTHVWLSFISSPSQQDLKWSTWCFNSHPSVNLTTYDTGPFTWHITLGSH